MRITRVRLAALVLIALVILGLASWTVESPAILSVQTPAQLQSSLLQFAKSESTQNFTDGSGFYSFKFGLDYSSNVSQGSHFELAAYGALVDESISSSFTRGVALALQSSSLLVDGRQDPSVKTISKIQPGLQVYYLQNPDTDIALGLHNMTVRLILSTVDVNYIGNFQGNTEIVSLPAVVNITSPT